uniref:Uncharacterized protein n=1 Tax=Manihot esculenta TaxID=3983 RepID=A0A2C9UL63_MANES
MTINHKFRPTIGVKNQRCPSSIAHETSLLNAGGKFYRMLILAPLFLWLGSLVDKLW